MTRTHSTNTVMLRGSALNSAEYEAGTTGRETARAADMGETTYSHAKRGRCRVTLEQAHAIARHLRTPLSAIVLEGPAAPATTTTAAPAAAAGNG